MRLEIGSRDALAFMIGPRQGKLDVAVAMIAEVKVPRVAVVCETELEVWAKVCELAGNPEQALSPGLQITPVVGGRRGRFAVGLYNRSGCVLRKLSTDTFENEQALRSWLAEMAADKHAALVWEAYRDATRRP